MFAKHVSFEVKRMVFPIVEATLADHVMEDNNDGVIFVVRF